MSDQDEEPPGDGAEEQTAEDELTDAEREEKARQAWASQLHKQVEKIKSGDGPPQEQAGPTSLRDRIHQRMRELDTQEPPSGPQEWKEAESEDVED